MIAECETNSTDTDYCYKIARKLAQSSKEELKYQLTVSESHLKIFPKKKLFSKVNKTFRRVFNKETQSLPLKRTTVYDSSFYNGSTVIWEPFVVAIGNETRRTGQKVFSTSQIVFCSILSEFPNVLFIVCQPWHNFKSFVYVLRFSDFSKCKMFHLRVKKLFKIEEEDFKTKAKKRFSCPFLESCNLSALKPLKQSKTI